MSNVNTKLETRAAIVRQLRRIHEENGELSNEFLRTLAPVAGCSVRTLRRDLERGLPSGGSRAPLRLTEEEEIMYFEFGGCVEAMCTALDELGKRRASPTTYRRAVRDQFDASQRGFAKRGEVGRRDATVYLSRGYEHRNAVWELDHVELDIEVVPPRGHKPIRPWATIAIDRDTKAVAGLAINTRQTSADVLVCIRHGISRDDRIGPVHGAPDMFVWDGGLEFLSNAVTEVAATLGSAAKALPPYMPHLKGTIERFNRTLKEQFLATLPYYTGGPRDMRGKLYGAPGSRLSYQELVVRLLDWVEHYNFVRPHSSLDSRTPAEVWSDDATAVRVFTEDELRWMALPSKTVKVGKRGAQIHGHHYFWPTAHAYFGRHVELRYMPHDERWVDVYCEDKFVARAKPSDTLAPEEVEELLASRHDSRERSSQLRRNASIRQGARAIESATDGKTVRFAPQNGTAPLEPVTAIKRDKARKEMLERNGIPVDADAGLQQINQPWHPPEIADSADEPEARS